MKNKKRTIYFILIILMTVLIWANSVLPANISGAQSGFVVNTVQSTLTIFGIYMNTDILSIIIRKSAHFVEFFILGLLWYQFLKELETNNKLVKWYAIIFCLVTALIDESIQLFSDGRAFQLTDIAIDLFGSSMAIFSLVFASYLQTKKGESV
ncbi:MAG: VanZ family protein [Acholeplasmataceae bacterium]|nr:VanZ family protein [Acholeplasmataceae bacterium]